MRHAAGKAGSGSGCLMLGAGSGRIVGFPTRLHLHALRVLRAWHGSHRSCGCLPQQRGLLRGGHWQAGRSPLSALFCACPHPPWDAFGGRLGRGRGWSGQGHHEPSAAWKGTCLQWGVLPVLREQTGALRGSAGFFPLRHPDVCLPPLPGCAMHTLLFVQPGTGVASTV